MGVAQLLDAMCDAVAPLNDSLHIRDGAPRLEAILLRNREKCGTLMGSSFLDIVDMEDRPKFEEYIERGACLGPAAAGQSINVRWGDSIGNLVKVQFVRQQYESPGGCSALVRHHDLLR